MAAKTGKIEKVEINGIDMTSNVNGFTIVFDKNGITTLYEPITISACPKSQWIHYEIQADGSAKPL
jgi:hypothetical protein